MSAKPIRIYRTALVIVHGLTNTAGSMSNISEFYQGKGYGMNELYATTYGPPNTAISMTDSITCAYVKQKNGLSIGSKFINDVNSQQGYEAQRIFMIRSSTDEVVGYNCTGRVTGDDNEVYTGSAEDDDEGYEGVGEYDVKNKRYKFPSGWYYYHVPSQQGQFLKN
ncbi:hypothetical protein M3Y99_01995500 [Aphelenchoides fujianensis]|nr:hypothetical protein M3Y99_01995500 [Aphelenchoides fujianensis]